MTEAMALAGMWYWKMVASSEGRKGERDMPVRRQGLPWPPPGRVSVAMEVTRAKE